MTSEIILDEIRSRLSAYEPTVKELLELRKDINRLLADEMHKAPFAHDGEMDYQTPAGKFCGICMRRKEREAA